MKKDYLEFLMEFTGKRLSVIQQQENLIFGVVM
jgi:hypothetical protein